MALIKNTEDSPAARLAVEVRNGTKVTGLPVRLNKRLRGADVLRCDFNE